MSPSDPTTEEMVAILAAIEVTWPRPRPVEAAPEKPPAWRFSGRWWGESVVTRRERPG